MTEPQTVEQALAEALSAVDGMRQYGPRITITGPKYEDIAAAILATESMQAIVRVVDAAVIWHEHKPSIPSPAFILDHAVTAMLGEPCSCGGRCELEDHR